MAEKNLNIQKVKDNTTLSRTTISNLLNNISAGVQFDTLDQLCKLLKCTPGDLFTHFDITIDYKKKNAEDKLMPEVDFELLMGEYKYTDQQSEVKSQCIVQCKLDYEGECLDFEFPLIVEVFLMDEEKFCIKGIASPIFKNTLAKYNLPFHVGLYIKNHLTDFIMNETDEEVDNLLEDWGYIERHYEVEIN